MTLKDIHCCILIPTFNNQKTLRRVIDGVLVYSGGEDVIVINDGSTDETVSILSEYGSRIQVIHNDRNRGKGYSLRRGFKEALSLGYKNAISIDSDGQHLPSDIPLFIEKAYQNPGALIMGSRNMEQEGVPEKVLLDINFRTFGLRLKRGWFYPIHKPDFDFTRSKKLVKSDFSPLNLKRKLKLL